MGYGAMNRAASLGFVLLLGVVSATPAAFGQETFFINFDSGLPGNGEPFSTMGSNWDGGFVGTQSVTAWYASGVQSFHVTADVANITFDAPVDRVEFFYVHDVTFFPPGTATAFDGADNAIGSVDSNNATGFGAPENFVTIDPVEPIARIEVTGGIIDNFEFTTLAVAEGEGETEGEDVTPIADPFPNDAGLSSVRVELVTVADGLVSPLGALFPDDGTGRMFVYDQAGIIWDVASPGDADILLDVQDRLVPFNFFDERGLLGAALHPDFASNGFLYTHTSEPVSGAADFTYPNSDTVPPDHQAVIARWTVSSKGTSVGGRTELLRVDQPQANHNGGTMRFGPDGFLYIALGDGGGADDEAAGHSPGGNGQDTSNVFGTLLRIDVDQLAGNPLSANGQYAIPADNPFVGTAGVDEIFAYGLRNPFSFSFDSESGLLYLGDVGQNAIEEINIIEIGGNYGWPIKEGSFLFDMNGEEPGFVFRQEEAAGPIDPIAEYDHDDGLSAIGGFVHRNPASELSGRYLFGDFSIGFGSANGQLYTLGAQDRVERILPGFPPAALGRFVKGFAQDLAGNVYVCTSDDFAPTGTSGQVHQLVALGEGAIEVPLTSPVAVVFMALLLACGVAVASWYGTRSDAPPTENGDTH